MLSVDGIAPATIVTPETAEEVAAALGEARENHHSVVPVGGETLLHIGNPPSSCEVALSTTRLTGLVEYNPADLTVVVRAGTTMAEVDEELARHGQFLPLHAPQPQRSTLGGALAANASGPWRTAYGSARDMVIGMRMALSSGEIARSGGKVVKNVAGYDIGKLFIGSYGTLGVIVEAALKVYPRPAQTRTLIFQVDELVAAFEVAARLRPIGPGLLTLAVVNAALAQTMDLDGVAAIATAGGSPHAIDDLVVTVESVTGRTPAIADSVAEARIFERMRDFPAEATMRLSTAPDRSRTLADVAGDEPFLSFPGIGLTFIGRGKLNLHEVGALRHRLQPERGHVVVLRALAEIKLEVNVWGRLGPELSLMRRVKDVFDPDGIMSPGRLVVP